MQIDTISENYSKLRYGFYKWRGESSLVSKAVLTLGGACLLGALAQLKIFLPWTPVPITGQTFGAVLLGVLLGRWWGGISTLVYIALGIAGVPWYSGFSSGISVLLGPTGGYFIGFTIAALFMGHVIDNYPRSRKLPFIFFVMTIALIVMVYIPGLIQLGLWLSIVKGNFPGIPELLWMGALPFIPGDLIKAAAGALIIHGISTEKVY